MIVLTNTLPHTKLLSPPLGGLMSWKAVCGDDDLVFGPHNDNIVVRLVGALYRSFQRLVALFTVFW